MDLLLNELGDVFISALISVVSIFMLGLLMRGVLVNAIAFGGENNPKTGFVQNQDDNDYNAIKNDIPKKVELSINNGEPIRIAKGSSNIDFYGIANYKNSSGQKVIFKSSDDLYVSGNKTFPNIQIFVLDLKTGLYMNSVLVNGNQQYTDINTYMKDKLNTKGYYALRYYVYNEYGMITTQDINMIID